MEAFYASMVYADRCNFGIFSLLAKSTPLPSPSWTGRAAKDNNKQRSENTKNNDTYDRDMQATERIVYSLSDGTCSASNIFGWDNIRWSISCIC